MEATSYKGDSMLLLTETGASDSSSMQFLLCNLDRLLNLSELMELISLPESYCEV